MITSLQRKQCEFRQATKCLPVSERGGPWGCEDACRFWKLERESIAIAFVDAARLARLVAKGPLVCLDVPS